MDNEKEVARIMTLDDAMTYWERKRDAEAIMGPLTREECVLLIKDLGRSLTLGELVSELKDKRALIIKEKNT